LTGKDSEKLAFLIVGRVQNYRWTEKYTPRVKSGYGVDHRAIKRKLLEYNRVIREASALPPHSKVEVGNYRVPNA